MKNPYPSLANILPTDDILILSLTPFHTVKPISKEVVFAMLAWRFINIGSLPWIKRNLLGKIGSTPALHSGWLFP
jgi:hypothetical protein